MRSILFILSLVSTDIYGAILGNTTKQQPGLVLKYGMGMDPGVSYNFDIPLNRDEIVDQGWVSVPRPEDSLIQGLFAYCMPNDYSVCILYDCTGYVSGVQISFAVEDVYDNNTDFSDIGFRIWNAPATDNSPARQYWTMSQYFTSADTLSKSDEERSQIRAGSNQVLYDGGVWVTNYSGGLTKLSGDASMYTEANGFYKQGCVPAMGQHYFYNVTTETGCDNLFPWFVLEEQGSLVATGWYFLGKLPDPPKDQRNWFEKPPLAIIEQVTPYASECAYQNAADLNIISLHLYYVQNPSQLGLDCAV